MPVNMDPSKKRRRVSRDTAPDEMSTLASTAPPPQRSEFGEETAADREKDLAEAESKNLWDATEVIDVDTA